LEVSESSTSLRGESRSDATDADASVLVNDPATTSCPDDYYEELLRLMAMADEMGIIH
jgi:hypothetical protein